MPSLEAHETIERAWKLHERQQREAQQGALQAKFESLQAAMVELERASPRLYDAAQRARPNVSSATQGKEGQQVSQAGRIPGLFPRQLRIPTETLGSQTFDESWTRPVDGLSKADS